MMSAYRLSQAATVEMARPDLDGLRNPACHAMCSASRNEFVCNRQCDGQASRLNKAGVTLLTAITRDGRREALLAAEVRENGFAGLACREHSCVLATAAITLMSQKFG